MIIDRGVLVTEFVKLLSNAYIHIFVFEVVFEILTGTVKSWKNKVSDSTVGLMGVIKHLLVVCLVLIAYPYLVILGFEPIAISFVLSFIVMYAISIVENWTQLGLPMPRWVTQRIAKLKDCDMFEPDYGDGQEGTENIWKKDKK